MSSHSAGYERLESIVAKLYVLRDSCKGIIHTEKSNPNLIWFRGAEVLLREAVEKLQKALPGFEAGEVVEPVVVEDTAEEAAAASEEEQEESSAEDESE